jgi:predicted DNA-binding transcriptional regulator AlpA
MGGHGNPQKVDRTMEFITSPFMRTEQAAAYLGISAKTLNCWRWAGIGPIFHKIGSRAVRYTQPELDAFVQTRRSTSDPGQTVVGREGGAQ